MSEMLNEYSQAEWSPPQGEELMTPEYQAEVIQFGRIEKAVADVAIEGSGLVEVSDTQEANIAVGGNFGGQLSIEQEVELGGWPVSDVEKGIVPSIVPESNYFHPPEMSPLEEARYTSRNIERGKAHEEWTSGKIDWDEFDKRTADKTPRTYQQSLLRQDGQVFAEEQPIIGDPNLGAGEEDGTFWHGSNQLMEPGDRVLPSGEVPTAVHEANKEDRIFPSSSSPTGTQYGKGEEDFAFGVPRDAGYLPTAYGERIYKVSSPNNKIVPTSNGPEVWAEGGAKVEKLMHPDFAYNYGQAAARVKGDVFQPGLPGMEKGMKFVPEADLDAPAKEFYEKHLKEAKESNLKATSQPMSGPEDVALPGFEEYGKRREAPPTASGSIM